MFGIRYSFRVCTGMTSRLPMYKIEQSWYNTTQVPVAVGPATGRFSAVMVRTSVSLWYRT
jgi:hypothetical protein